MNVVHFRNDGGDYVRCGESRHTVPAWSRDRSDVTCAACWREVAEEAEGVLRLCRGNLISLNNCRADRGLTDYAEWLRVVEAAIPDGSGEGR